MGDTQGETPTGANDMAKHDTKKCTVSCKHDGEDPSPTSKKQCEWIRCCLCVHWYHPECVGLPQKQTSGVWSCHSCRNIANEVSELKVTVKLLLDIVRIIQYILD